MPSPCPADAGDDTVNSATRRAVARATMATAVLLAAAACGDTSPASPHRTSSASSARQQRPTAEARTTPFDRNPAMDIRVTLDGRPVDATLNDSPAARYFAELLPLTLDLEDWPPTKQGGSAVPGSSPTLWERGAR